MQIQQLQLNNLAEIANKKSMPKLGAFGQIGYGRPGLNQLSNSFEGYAIGGLRLSWNLSSLYTLQNEKQVIQLQSKSIDAQKEAFVLQTETNISSQIADIEKYKKLIVSDNQIIEFRKKIKTAAQAMLDNGVTTYQDFLKDLDAEETAKTTKAMHEIQLLQSQYQLQLLFGNL
jgi:outer membrane protein TolC